jgi:hypothetical protein
VSSPLDFAHFQAKVGCQAEQWTFRYRLSGNTVRKWTHPHTAHPIRDKYCCDAVRLVDFTVSEGPVLYVWTMPDIEVARSFKTPATTWGHIPESKEHASSSSSIIFVILLPLLPFIPIILVGDTKREA